MTDATLDDTTDEATVRVTYAELAAARGVSIAAARRLTLRHRWQKQIGNDGLTRVVVPVAFVEDASKEAAPALDEATIAAIAEATTVAVTDALTGVATVAIALDNASIAAITRATTVAVTDAMAVAVTDPALTSLRANLAAAIERADRAESRVREMEEQAADHRRIVEALIARIPSRRSWLPWRRR